MFAINLDPNFKPYSLESIPFEAFTFAGGEPHIKINAAIQTGTPVHMSHRIQSFADLGIMLMATDALKGMNLKLASLTIPYFPAARQDRRMINGEPLSVKVYADIINGLGFECVNIWDAHSDVTPALLDRCNNIDNYAFINDALHKIGENVVLISPDGGALKKIYKLSEALGGIPVIECSKVRDVKTGKLQSFRVYEDELNGKHCLMVDDICDGGGTFSGLADALQAKNAGHMYLAVTHGIFAKGIELISSKFKHIYTTNSFKDLSHPSVSQFKLQINLAP